MGSPISVVIANLVMEDVEQRALATFHSPPRFWKRYVDDTFMVIPCNLVQEFLSHLNSIEACIQFTVGKETEDRKLPFLDVCLCRVWWVCHYISVQKTNAHQPVPVLWLTPLCGTQGLRGENVDEQSQWTIVQRCDTCGRGEESCGCFEAEWLPNEVHQRHSRSSNLPRPAKDDRGF